MRTKILQQATDAEIASFRLVMTINMLGHVLGRTLPLEFTTQDCIEIVELAIDKLMEPAQPAPDAGLNHIISCHGCGTIIGYSGVMTGAQDGAICGNCAERRLLASASANKEER